MATENGVHSEKPPTGSNSDESIAANEANEGGQDASEPVGREQAETVGKGWLSRAPAIRIWTPRRCRYDPDNPPEFTLGMNILFALVRIFLSWLFMFLSIFKRY